MCSAPVASSYDRGRPGGPVLSLRGELDIAVVPDLLGVLDGLCSGPVVVDLSEVTFVDSSAAQALAAEQEHFARLGHRLEIRGAGAFPRRVFALLELDGVLGA